MQTVDRFIMMFINVFMKAISNYTEFVFNKMIYKNFFEIQLNESVLH